ncbi:hypothetical protein HQ535_11460 [bacterium]|nr:hypothetical protein [bacterium]
MNTAKRLSMVAVLAIAVIGIAAIAQADPPDEAPTGPAGNPPGEASDGWWVEMDGMMGEFDGGDVGDHFGWMDGMMGEFGSGLSGHPCGFGADPGA